jgi:hypothetical protein
VAIERREEGALCRNGARFLGENAKCDDTVARRGVAGFFLQLAQGGGAGIRFARIEKAAWQLPSFELQRVPPM